MKFLFVSPYLPHPKSGHGGGVYLYKLIERLSSHHQITLVTFCDGKELELATDLKSLPIRFHSIDRVKGRQAGLLPMLLLIFKRAFQLFMSILRWEPYNVSKFRDRRMKALLQRLDSEESFDLVQIVYTQLAPYEELFTKGKTVLQEIDVNFRPSYHRYKHARSIGGKFITFVEWCRWARYETRLARTFDHVLTITDQDRMLLAWMTKMNHISYSAHPIEIPANVPEYRSREARTLVFVGSFMHSANTDAALWLVEKIFPLVTRSVPDAKLYIIGPYAPASLESAAKSQAGIQLMGFVDDVDVYLRKGSVSIAPMRLGGGVKTKVLYAMAQGIPIVGTRVAVAGIDGFTSEEALIGETPQQLADHVCALFSDRELAARIGSQGRDLVKKWYSWESELAKLETTYRQLTESQPAKG